MKIITIKSCSECPYHNSEMPDVFIEGGEYCEHTKFKHPKKYVISMKKSLFQFLYGVLWRIRNEDVTKQKKVW